MSEARSATINIVSICSSHIRRSVTRRHNQNNRFNVTRTAFSVFV